MHYFPALDSILDSQTTNFAAQSRIMQECIRNSFFCVVRYIPCKKKQIKISVLIFSHYEILNPLYQSLVLLVITMFRLFYHGVPLNSHLELVTFRVYRRIYFSFIFLEFLRQMVQNSLPV